jgi:Flp pilus assembly pilin Flp
MPHTQAQKDAECLFCRLQADQRGVSTVEYFILLAFLGLGVIGVVRALESAVRDDGKLIAEHVSTLSSLSRQDASGSAPLGVAPVPPVGHTTGRAGR